MAKPNYQFAKRQKELAKQKKKEEKRQKKLDDKLAAAEAEKNPAPGSLGAPESAPGESADGADRAAEIHE
jgi:hypothetical protein